MPHVNSLCKFWKMSRRRNTDPIKIGFTNRLKTFGASSRKHSVKILFEEYFTHMLRRRITVRARIRA